MKMPSKESLDFQFKNLCALTKSTVPLSPRTKDDILILIAQLLLMNLYRSLYGSEVSEDQVSEQHTTEDSAANDAEPELNENH